MSLLFVSCGGGGSGSGSQAGTGTLELGLTDAAGHDYQAVYVTIGEVQVKQQGEGEGEAGWQTVVTPEETYNLLELANGVIVPLGAGELAAGKYGQMRLILGELADPPDLNILGEPHPFANYVIDSEGASHELKVPSGYQTGIKIVKGFTIAAVQTTELILDFDAAESVVQAGKSGKWLLKPTIKVLETVDNSAGGTVDDGSDPIAGALVSAQIYDPGAADPKDRVTVESSSVTDANGEYVLLLPPDTYNLVATMEGYIPACLEVEAQFFEEYITDFTLEPAAAAGTAAGLVSGLTGNESFATLSFRQILDCGSGPVMVEIVSLNVGEGGEYELVLPAGAYQIVASAEGEITQTINILVADAAETIQDITF